MSRSKRHFCASLVQCMFSSLVFRRDGLGRYAMHQRLPSKGAVAVATFNSDSDHYLLIANSRDNFGDYKQEVSRTYRVGNSVPYSRLLCTFGAIEP